MKGIGDAGPRRLLGRDAKAGAVKPLTRVRQVAAARDRTRAAHEQAIEKYRAACVVALDEGYTLEEVAQAAGVTKQAIFKLVR